MQYNHKQIEKKWQDFWFSSDLFKAIDEDDKKEKIYILDMFPYPSGSGLHVGHPEGYTATDIITRYKRMNDYNVLHPMGWDAFGLPAENYAIKTKIHPDKSTHENIVTFKKQIKSLGFSYDWDREVATCDADYYKWTQWWFLFLYKQGLAYKKNAPVNYCESCQTVLANEQVVQGNCERCKNQVIQKNLSQWFFKITDFLEDQDGTTGLINGLDKIDWPESTKIAQRNWIGKSEGINITYKIDNTDLEVTVFTTRPDTNFGATFIVLAPDCEFVTKNLNKFPEIENCKKYIEETKKKTELERMSEGKKKTGAFTGFYAINNLNAKKMPIYLSDFVLGHVGTGCVVGVPGHDMRDFEFAKTMNIEIIRVVVKKDGDSSEITSAEQVQENEGTMINSDFLNGLDIHEAKNKIMEYIEEKGFGKKVTNYKMRDWLVSRQRYWGAPIPIIYCTDCGEIPVPENDLPVLLPTDVDFMPTGQSPLLKSKTFHDVKCPKCRKSGEGVRRESDTMDTFVCSSWYFFRFIDPKNDKVFADKDLLKTWGNVDLYVGGAEHTVLHLLYARFFCKALHRAGYIDYDEPFQKLRHQGIILGEDGEKMSKSRGNVINPDIIIDKYGSDTLRMYEMFMGPFKDMKPWSSKSVEGIYRFLNRVWKLCDFSVIPDQDRESSKENSLINLRHKTIKKVTQDIENFSFNTAISALMIYSNEMLKSPLDKGGLGDLSSQSTRVCLEDIKTLILLLSPFAPHMTEELWHEALGNKESIQKAPWPKYDENLTKDNEVEIVIQINGKLRGSFLASPEITKEEALAQAKQVETIQKYLAEGEIRKEIFVPGKLVNLVIT